MTALRNQDLIIYAVAFVVIFLLGGFVAMASLPEFSGRFFVGGGVLVALAAVLLALVKGKLR